MLRKPYGYLQKEHDRLPQMTTNQNEADRTMQMITGYWVTQVVYAAATFSIADHLAKSPATVDDIADAERIDPLAAFRPLRTCASLGVGQI